MTREEIDEGWDQLRAEMTKTLGELANTNHLLDTYIVGAAVARIAHMFNIVIAEVDLLRARVKELSALPVTNRIAPENFTGKAIKINGRTCRVLRHDVYLRDHWYVAHDDGTETSMSEADICKALGKQS